MPRPVQPTFWRLDGRIGWHASENSQQIYYDDAAGGLRLGDQYATAILPTEPGGTFGGVTRPTGLAVGPDGRLFLADPHRDQILSYTTHDEAFLPLWEPPTTDSSESDVDPRCILTDELSREPRTAAPPALYHLSEPRGVAVSRDGDLVVADTGHGRVIIYTWPGLAVRHIIDLGDGEPWDLDYDANGHLYVADAAGGRVHRFDRLWRPDVDYLGGAGTLQRPKHLAFDSTDQLFVLDESLRQVIALDAQGRPLSDTDLKLYRRTFPPPLRLDGEGLWLPQDERPNCPALLLKGLEVDRGGRLKGRGLMLLARPVGVTYPPLGRYVSEELDSGIHDCAWHRLVLDVDLPEATGLTLRTFTAPAPLEPSRIASLPDNRWSPALTLGPGDWTEVLIQSPPGQYLWLNVELSSNGQATPLIRAMTLYAPRQSSLGYLPPVFHEDAVSADFLDRFLSYFDTVFDEIESQIERFTGYLDPDGVPAGDFLAWLGSWFDIEFLAEWSDRTRREFVRRAISLYKQRGTVAGLQAILRLHTGLEPPQPFILEHFRLHHYHERYELDEPGLVDSKLYMAGRPLMPGDGEFAHRFTVLLPNQAAPNGEALDTLQRLIEAQKPAHTRYEIRVVAPGLRIGCQSTVGVDTLIGHYPAAPLGDAKLGQGSQLASSRPRLGHTRLTFST